MMLPDWYSKLLGASSTSLEFERMGHSFVLHNGIFRAKNTLSESQSHTKDTFGFKWEKEDTFDSETSCMRMRQWLQDKYGDLSSYLNTLPESPIVMDAGCGAALSFLELWDDFLPVLKYVGVDVSSAVDVAAKRFEERGYKNAAFLQASLTELPFENNSFDIIFSEGVLHHTDNTEASFKYLSQLIKPGGYFMFYVYKKKAPAREFTDDYIREKIANMSQEEAWNALKPLTQLGITLGKLNTKITVEEDVDVLGIKAGEIDIQRLFYWYVCKAFYNPDLTFDEMHHINFDWFAPTNAHRHTPEEVRNWCRDVSFDIVHEKVEEAGITVIARKR